MPTPYAWIGTTAATNLWTTVTNWSPNGTPGAGDSIVGDGRALGPLTGSPAASPQLARIDWYANSKAFGTPASPIAVGATEINVNLPAPDGSTSGGTEFHINTGTNAGSLCHLFSSPSTGTSGQEPCTFKSGTPGSGSNAVVVSGGVLGIATGSPGDAATINGDIKCTGGQVNIGSGTVTGFNVTTSGTGSPRVFCYAATSGTLTCFAGSITTEGTALVATVTGYGGNLYLNHRVAGASNSITTMNVRGATFDFSGDASAVQIGTTSFRKGSIVAAANNQLTLTTVTLDFDANTKLQLSAAA